MKEISIECPYCGQKNIQQIQLYFNQYSWPQVLMCDDFDEGGCGAFFVARVRFVPQVQTQKIEGEENCPGYVNPGLEEFMREVEEDDQVQD